MSGLKMLSYKSAKGSCHTDSELNPFSFHIRLC
jgi:hypothetical protein